MSRLPLSNSRMRSFPSVRSLRAGALVPLKTPAGSRDLDAGARPRNASCYATCAAAEGVGTPCSPSGGPSSGTYRQPQSDDRDNPGHPRPHPIRARVHQVKLGKITSLKIVSSACWPVGATVGLSRAAISGFGVVGTVTGL